MERYIKNSTKTLIFSMPLLLLVIRDWVVLSFLLLVVTASLSLIYQKNEVTISKQERLLMAFFLAAFLSTLATYLFGDFTQVETKNLVRYLMFVGFLPVFLLIRKNGLPQNAFWYGVVIGAIIAGVVALTEIIFLDRSRAGAAHNSIVFGDHALLLGILSLLSIPYLSRKNRYLALLPVLGFLSGMLASMLSGSRGGWVAVPVFLLIIAIYFTDLGSIKARASYILVFAILAVVAFSIPQTGIQNRINQAIVEINDYRHDERKSSSVWQRLEMWRASIELSTKKPVLGVGLRQYHTSIKELVDATDKYDPAIRNYTHPHNEYLFALVERGVVGLVTILLILFYPAYLFVITLRRQDESLRPIAIAGLVIVSGYAIFGLTEAMFNRSLTVNYYTMMMALLLGALFSKQESLDS